MPYIPTGCENERDIAYMQILDKRLEEDANNVQALIEKGFLLVYPFGKIEEGIANLKLAVQLAPTNLSAYFWLAEGIYHGLCDNEATRDILEKCLMMDSERADCYVFLASILNSLGESSQKSINCLKKAIELEPNWILPRLSLSYYYLDDNHVQEAECIAQEAFHVYKNGVFPIIKTPFEDYYVGCITGCYPEIKNNIDNLFLAIHKKRQEIHNAQ